MLCVVAAIAFSQPKTHSHTAYASDYEREYNAMMVYCRQSLPALSLFYTVEDLFRWLSIIRVHARRNDLRVQIMFNNIIRHVFNLLKFKLNAIRCARGDVRSCEMSTIFVWYLCVIVLTAVVCFGSEKLGNSIGTYLL